MNNSLRTGGLPCRKQITFDLNENKLKERYPRPEGTLNPEYYKKAWKDVARFMIRNGFEHRQYSVYDSKTEMTETEVNTLVRAMVRRMPWIYQCLDAIDVTDIGAQHDLLPTVEDVGTELFRHRTPHNND